MTSEIPDYSPALIRHYLALPHTPNRPSRQDFALARLLHHRRVPWLLIQASFALATLRRDSRSSVDPPLSPIRSLAYFLPVIEELRLASPTYWEYCCYRFQSTHSNRHLRS